MRKIVLILSIIIAFTTSNALALWKCSFKAGQCCTNCNPWGAFHDCLLNGYCCNWEFGWRIDPNAGAGTYEIEGEILGKKVPKEVEEFKFEEGHSIVFNEEGGKTLYFNVLPQTTLEKISEQVFKFKITITTSPTYKIEE